MRGDLDPISIARGDVPNLRAVHKFGYNSEITTAGNEDIIEQGGLQQYNTGGVAIEVLSGEAADTMDVWVEGLDGSYNWVREYTTLNGTTPVPLATSFYTVFRARVLGSTAPAGQITWRTVSGSTTQIIVAAGDGGTLVAALSIPNNHKFYLEDIMISANGTLNTATFATHIQLYGRSAGGVWTVQDDWELISTGNIPVDAHYAYPRAYTGPYDLRIYVEDTSSTIRAAGAMNGVLERTDGNPVAAGVVDGR